VNIKKIKLPECKHHQCARAEVRQSIGVCRWLYCASVDILCECRWIESSITGDGCNCKCDASSLFFHMMWNRDKNDAVFGTWVVGHRIEYYYGSTALCWALASFSLSWSYTQSVGLIGREISPSQGRYLHTGQHKYRINAHRHPCLEWDSNTRSQRLCYRRQSMP
jgi:hypothetical protein